MHFVQQAISPEVRRILIIILIPNSIIILAIMFVVIQRPPRIPPHLSRVYAIMFDQSDRDVWCP